MNLIYLNKPKNRKETIKNSDFLLKLLTLDDKYKKIYKDNRCKLNFKSYVNLIESNLRAIIWFYEKYSCKTGGISNLSHNELKEFFTLMYEQNYSYQNILINFFFISKIFFALNKRNKNFNQILVHIYNLKPINNLGKKLFEDIKILNVNDLTKYISQLNIHPESFKIPLHCNNCGYEVYHSLLYYYCKNCLNKVSIHDKTDIPRGTLANQELTEQRQKMHGLFHKKDKNKFYIMLKQAGFKIHIGHMSNEDIKEVKRYIDYAFDKDQEGKIIFRKNYYNYINIDLEKYLGKPFIKAKMKFIKK